MAWREIVGEWESWLEPESLQSSRKAKSVSHPRMLAMWLARKYTRAALSEIGQYFGHRSHSTVVSAQKRVDRWIADDATLDPQAYEFYRLGRGKLVRVSTLQNRHRQELLDMIVERLPAPEHVDPLAAEEPPMKVAIVGRRNVGKSTLVKLLLRLCDPTNTEHGVPVKVMWRGKTHSTMPPGGGKVLHLP